MLNLGILISGRGSNMESILRSVRAAGTPINPAVVISNRPGAPGLETARGLGVGTEVVDSGPFGGDGEGRRRYDAMVMDALRRHGVTPEGGLVCLAGFMRILGPELVGAYRNRILNIHPALLPSFPGLHSQRQALRYGAKVSGCTVHFVDAGTDTGPVVIQKAVEVRDDDTEESLSARILREEHRIYPEAVDLFARGLVRVSGRRVTVTRPP